MRQAVKGMLVLHSQGAVVVLTTNWKNRYFFNAFIIPLFSLYHFYSILYFVFGLVSACILCCLLLFFYYSSVFNFGAVNSGYAAVDFVYFYLTSLFFFFKFCSFFSFLRKGLSLQCFTCCFFFRWRFHLNVHTHTHTHASAHMLFDLKRKNK